LAATSQAPWGENLRAQQHPDGNASAAAAASSAAAQLLGQAVVDVRTLEPGHPVNGTFAVLGSGSATATTAAATAAALPQHATRLHIATLALSLHIVYPDAATPVGTAVGALDRLRSSGSSGSVGERAAQRAHTAAGGTGMLQRPGGPGSTLLAAAPSPAASAVSGPLACDPQASITLSTQSFQRAERSIAERSAVSGHEAASESSGTHGLTVGAAVAVADTLGKPAAGAQPAQQAKEAAPCHALPLAESRTSATAVQKAAQDATYTDGGGKGGVSEGLRLSHQVAQSDHAGAIEQPEQLSLFEWLQARLSADAAATAAALAAWEVQELRRPPQVPTGAGAAGRGDRMQRGAPAQAAPTAASLSLSSWGSKLLDLLEQYE
jgi:hypothetical protein